MRLLLQITILTCIAPTLIAQIIFKDKNGKYGIKDKTGKILAKPIYTFIRPFSEDIANVAINNNSKIKWGF
jgi:hypothetical protein